MHSEILSAFQILIPNTANPKHCHKLRDLETYHQERCSESVIRAEYMSWCQQINLLEDKNIPINEEIDFCNANYFPNIHKLIRHLATLPVTSCTAERSLSTMRRMKTILRNSIGKERLTNAARLSLHAGITIDANDVLDLMATKKNRRLQLL